MINEQFIRDRITKLRLQNNVSEYKMSLDLGHSKSYIQSISSGRSMPSMSEFLSICEYLDVTPKDFFDDNIAYPISTKKITDALYMLDESDLKIIEPLILRLKKS